MRRRTHHPPLINIWVLLGALAFAGCLTALTFVLIGWTRPKVAQEVGFTPADLTMIPAPTHTPGITPTAAFDPLATPSLEPGTIGVGGYVQIAGTEGHGLRLRSAAGLGSEQLFLGYDEEVYQVREGPKEADGLIWWYLVAPYDETRAGWAAADYLSVVPSP